MPPSSSVSRFVVPARGFGEQLADFGRAGEGELVHVRMLDERAAGFARAGDDVHHAIGGSPASCENLREMQRGDARRLRGLEHARCCRRRAPARVSRRP